MRVVALRAAAFGASDFSRPHVLEALADGIQRAVNGPDGADRPAVVVCGQLLRRPLQRTLDSLGLDVPVLSYPELPDGLDLTQTGVIGDATVAA